MPSKANLVEARTLKGFQDLLPADVIPRRTVVRIIEDVFERYGFAPVETPALEHLDVLLGTGGEEVNKELFRLQSPEDEPVAMRFDLTVPFARLLAQYPDQVKVPFRRYTIGTVWRADKPDMNRGRYRQFTQCDIDIAGSDSVACDAEVVAAVCEVMDTLAVPRYRVLINNRKLVDALLEGCGITEVEVQKHVLRVIDKLQKVGVENVRRELGPGRVDDSGDPIKGVGLETDVIDQILAFVAVTGASRAEVVDHVAEALPESGTTEAAVGEMRELNECLDALGVDEARAVFAPSLARGLDYYTGPVFEIQLEDAMQFGSVGGGGRYDGLVERFLNRPVKCTGISIGLDRFMAALGHLGVLPDEKTRTQALVVTMGNVPRHETLRIAAELRDAGLRAETYFASKKKMNMKFQLSHADLYQIPVAVIIGEDELANGVVSIKDLYAGKREREDIEDREEYRKAGKTGQVTVPRAEMVGTVRAIIEEDQRGGSVASAGDGT